MSKITDQLRQYGEAVERVAAAQPSSKSASEGPYSEGYKELGATDKQGTKRIFVAAIAAFVLGAVGIGLALLSGGSAQEIRSADQQIDMSLEERIESLDRSRQLLVLARSDDVATDLGSEAVVLRTDDVGFVEVGPPWDGLVQSEPWLADSHCVSTLAVVGCVAVVDQESGRRKTWATSHSGTFRDVSDGGPGQPVTLYGTTPTPTLVTTLLPENAALVVVSFGDERKGQIPVQQTAVVAVPPDARNFQIGVFDDGGGLVSQSVLELPDRPLDGLIGDLPAGAGNSAGEEIEPTVAIGTEAIWPQPLEPGGPEVVAQRFASEVLGWGSPAVTVDPDATPEGPTWVTIASDTGSDLEVLVAPFGDRGWGAVQIGEATSISIADQPEGWTQIEIRPIPDAASVDIYISDLSGKIEAWRAGLTSYVGPISVVVPGPDLEQTATVLMLYNDLMGRTVAVHGGQYESG